MKAREWSEVEVGGGSRGPWEREFETPMRWLSRRHVPAGLRGSANPGASPLRVHNRKAPRPFFDNNRKPAPQQ